MGFEFKHLAFITILVCSGWAMIVSGLNSVDELGKIKFKSEIPQEEGSNFASTPLESKFESIIKVLNTALPIAALAIVLLIITYSSNPIGMGSLVFAIAIFLFAATKAIDAADIIDATTEFSVSTRVWWM